MFLPPKSLLREKSSTTLKGLTKMIADNQECKIVQVDADTNAFVVMEDNKEVFIIYFSKSIIRKFISALHGYILLFQCRSAVKEKYGNICFVSRDGKILWWAERKRPDDCYVELNITNDLIIGYDGSYNCHIDINTGKIIKRELIK
jgi:hypothetical protein